MNKIRINDAVTEKFKPKRGDIWRNGEIIYLLCCFVPHGAAKGQWMAISLQDGHYWDSPCATADLAVRGLDFVGRDMEIELKFGAN